MSASRPEADIEYSRAHGASRGRPGAAAGALRGAAGGVPAAVFGGALVGAILLVAAEFLPLLQVHSGAYGGGVVQTISAGSHHSYALLPVAVLTLVMAIAARATGNRLALASIGALGLVALGIALLGDLPDAHASGLIRRAGTYAPATSSVAVGFYLETLGAAVLLVAAGAGLLLGGVGRGSFGPRTIVGRRSAS